MSPLTTAIVMRERPGVHEVGVRVERLQHSGDRPVDQPVRLDRAHVIRLDRAQGRRKDPVLFGHLVFNG